MHSGTGKSACATEVRTGHGLDAVTEMLPVSVGRLDASGRHPRLAPAGIISSKFSRQRLLPCHRPMASAVLVCNSAALRRFPSIQAAEFKNNSALPKQEARLPTRDQPCLFNAFSLWFIGAP